MPKPRKAWLPLPHEPVRKLSDNLWWVRAPIPQVPLNRSMTLTRLADGRLVIWNAVALDEPSMGAIEAWGEPAILVVPSELHRLDAAAYQARYPKLRIYAPSGARKAVERVVPLDGALQDCPLPAGVGLRPLGGIKDKEGVMLVQSEDGTTVVLNDVLFNMPLPTATVARVLVTLLGSAPGPRVSRAVKLLWCQSSATLREEFEKLAKIPDLTRVVVAHDSVAEGEDARKALLAAAAQLS